jgi:signal recognition particle receptor subunit beta
MQTQTVKIVVTGPFNSGKTELIRSVSEIDVVSTERKITNDAKRSKKIPQWPWIWSYHCG